MVYHPHRGAPYPPDLILHGEQRHQLKNPNATVGKHENKFFKKLISERLLVITLCYFVFQRLLIAEHLSARLPILQSVLLVGGVWPQLLSYFSNAMKGVACAQTSILLRNAIKISYLQKLCMLM